MSARTPQQASGGTRGRFLAFEGGEASGKSTQAARLAARLGAVLTHEPGATPVGEKLRSVLLDPLTPQMSVRAEALLLAADRAQHVAEVILPNLDSGCHVVTDRYMASSLAYQGFGRGLPLDEVRELSIWATQGLLPDVTILLDVPTEVAQQRLTGRADRFEAEDGAFHRRVIEGYRTLAASDPQGWVVIDGTDTPDEVERVTWSVVLTRLPDLSAPAEARAGDSTATQRSPDSP
jgi:dTMP kinase